MFIGGKQVRPDSGYSTVVRNPAGTGIGEVGTGNRKDIRNAVEAAQAASRWSESFGHQRAQILYYIAENLSARREEFTSRIALQTGRSRDDALEEVDRSIERLFSFAAWADKFDGLVHHTPYRNISIAMPEAIGVMAVVAPTRLPLLGFVSVVAPPLAMGNRVVAVPSETHPLSATDLYQVLETSDVPAGAVNIVTGPRDTLSRVLAEHDDVDGIWYFGPPEGVRLVEEASAGNMKRTWAHDENRDLWLLTAAGLDELQLRESTQVKNIWVPYGE
jgi:aldehyde dehydrogenase (NAD+)